MSRLPIAHYINEIKNKLGFTRTMTAPGSDVVDAVNKQSEKIDALNVALAYVENGNTASKTYTSGEYVLWKNVLYTVKSGGLPQGTTISTTYLDPVTGGGLNVLNGNISNAITNLISIVNYTGDLNNVCTFGCYRCDSTIVTNVPNTTNLAWIVFAFGGNYNDIPFGLQLAIGYAPSDVYMRRIWGTWESWTKLN